MQVGDLVTHRPSGAVGIIVEESENSVCVLWSVDPVHGAEGKEEWISKLFVGFLKADK